MANGVRQTTTGVVNTTTGVAQTVAGATVLEDHESGDSVSNLYNGVTADYTNTNDTALEGNWRLEIDDTFSDIGHASTTCSRGNKYKCRMINDGGSTSELRFAAFQQDATDIFANSYVMKIDWDSDQIKITYWASGSSSTNANTTLSESITNGTEYRPVIEVDSTGVTDNVTARMLKSDGTDIGSVSISDDNLTGGTFGFSSADSGDGKLDYVTEESL